MKIAIATKNLGKFNEFKELSVDTDYEFIQIPSSVQEMPPENGTSFYANALIKAKYIPFSSAKYFASVLYIGGANVSGKIVRKSVKDLAFCHSSSFNSPSIVIL